MSWPLKKIQLLRFVYCFVLLILTGYFDPAVAQSSYSEVKPGVNAQQFISPYQVSNSLHIGQPTVNIPLFELRSKGVTVPIAASFNAGGVTNESEASSIGLGWSLLAGGVITQSVRGQNDLQITTYNNKVWQYQQNYLQDKWYEESIDLYDVNKFDAAMDPVVGGDGEPDLFSYSFLGYAGNICFRLNPDNSSSATLYPDKSFKITSTTNGYRITASDGAEYYFEQKEMKVSSATSWFLTKIKTLQGGEVTFQYDTEYSYDLSMPNGPGSYAVTQSKRLQRIDFESGYVVFSAASRPDSYYSGNSTDAQRIVNIELYNKAGLLVKGYEFNNAGYFSNQLQSGLTWHNRRMKLESIREYGAGGNFLPAYKFQYDYSFTLPKTSAVSESFPLPKGTWAHNPSPNAFVDRDFAGNPSPIVQYQPVTDPGGTTYYIPTVYGFSTSTDDISGYTIGDYLSLTRIDLPSGGSEAFFYEHHDYGSFAGDQSSSWIPTIYDQRSQLSGRRLQKRETHDSAGNIYLTEYTYRRHEETYDPESGGYSISTTSQSSGVLVNPSIHSSTVYAPVYDHNNPRLGAIPNETIRPQNSFSGSSVYYTEVEELFRTYQGATNGKKISFFEKMYALPAANYVYLNYNSDNGTLFTRGNRLISIPNIVCGKQSYPPDPNVDFSQQYFTYMTHPVGRFIFPELFNGKLLKEVVLDAAGNVIRKVENEYTAGYGIEENLYGLIPLRFDDNNYGSNPNPAFDVRRYLICQTVTSFGTRLLMKQTTTSYATSGLLVQEESFQYTNKNLPKASLVKVTNAVIRKTEYVYPDEITFATQSGLSVYAATLHQMMVKNVIGNPVQTTVKKGDRYIGGDYKTFKQLPNGAIVVDTIFALEGNGISAVNNPFVNASGQVVRTAQFIPQVVFSRYDVDGNVQERYKVNDHKEVYVWGYERMYPVARIVGSNADAVAAVTQAQVDNVTVPGNDVAVRNLLNNLRTLFAGDKTVQVTTFTYKPFVGMTSDTDPNGVTTYYEFDEFGRLTVVRNQFQQILKQISYSFVGTEYIPYYNEAKSQVFTRNNCTGGQVAGTYTYTVPANTYIGSSQQEANQLALNDIAQNGQAAANQYATCTVIYLSPDVSGYYYSQNCPPGTALPVYISKPLGAHTSAISEYDAYMLAVTDAQNQANAYGGCNIPPAIVFNGANGTPYGVMLVLTNTSNYNNYYFNIGANNYSLAPLGNIEPGTYNIQIILDTSWASFYYSVAGYYGWATYTTNLYNIQLDQYNNAISIY
jgi:YD repeat-containing protein